MATAPVEQLEWEIAIPLLTNRHFMGGLIRAFVGGAMLIIALVALLLGMQGNWEAVRGLALMMMVITLGLLLTAVLVVVLIFGNRMRLRFTIDGTGARMQTIDRVARAGNRGALVLGVLTGRAGAAGSGLLAQSQEDQMVSWGGRFTMVVEPATHSMAFRNSWRTILRVYCLPENFAVARALVEAQMASHGTAQRSSTSSPLGGYLLRTVLVVVACLPIFAACGLFGLTLLPPLLLLCFALATVWFVPPMAWAVLALELGIVVLMAGGALGVRTSYISGETYRRYTVLSGDDWALTALAVVGMAGLAWMAVATLRARIKPALTSDLMDAGDDSA